MAGFHEHITLSVFVALVALLVPLNGLPTAQVQVDCSSNTVSACVQEPADWADSCPLYPATVPARLGLPEGCWPGLYTVNAASARDASIAEGPEADRQGRLQSGLRFQDCPGCPEMVVVPVGSFMMGSPPGEAGQSSSEGPQHQVVIGHPFAVGAFEVTLAQV